MINTSPTINSSPMINTSAMINSSADAEAIWLQEWFVPTERDVICGWARQHHRHGKPDDFWLFCSQNRKQWIVTSNLYLCLILAGNQRFKLVIERSAPLYTAARTKHEKTNVIQAVVEKVRSESPGGGFVKRDLHTGRWFEIGDDKSRDKGKP
jgi:hypothetical protein